jgi:hypothetical protein
MLPVLVALARGRVGASQVEELAASVGPERGP